MELRKRSIHELRGIAQSFGVYDIFEKDTKQLAQEIELKQQKLLPAKQKPPESPRFLDSHKTDIAEPKAIVDMLQDHIKLGLRLNLTEDGWSMSCGLKHDSGTMHMPLAHILRCADRLMT